MATVSLKIPSTSDGPPEGVLYRMSADEYFRAVEAGVFPPDRRIGLWEGQLYEKMAKKVTHSVASAKVFAALARALPAGWFLWPESPILADDFTAPLPDAALVRGAPDDYARRGSVPRAGEVGLVVELADATLKKNLTDALGKYAWSGSGSRIGGSQEEPDGRPRQICRGGPADLLGDQPDGETG